MTTSTTPNITFPFPVTAGVVVQHKSHWASVVPRLQTYHLWCPDCKRTICGALTANVPSVVPRLQTYHLWCHYCTRTLCWQLVVSYRVTASSARKILSVDRQLQTATDNYRQLQTATYSYVQLRTVTDSYRQLHTAADSYVQLRTATYS